MGINYKGDYVTALIHNAGYFSDYLAETIDTELLRVICYLCGSECWQDVCNSCKIARRKLALQQGCDDPPEFLEEI